MAKTNYAELHAEAHEAGMKAAEATKPTPMVVAQHANPLDDSSPVTRAWRVPAGVCGFATVRFDGRTGFGRYMKREGLARKGFDGLRMSIFQFNQSYELKTAYAAAYANYLTANGVRGVRWDSRLD